MDFDGDIPEFFPSDIPPNSMFSSYRNVYSILCLSISDPKTTDSDPNTPSALDKQTFVSLIAVENWRAVSKM